MLGLLYKDIYLQRKKLIPFFIGLIILPFLILLPFKIAGVQVPTALIDSFGATLPILFWMIADSIIGFAVSDDEKRLWSDMIASSPQGIRGFVKSKYIFNLLLLSIISASSLIITPIYAILSEDSCIIMMNMSAMVFYLGVFTKAIEFPFIFRFGSKTGNNVRSAMMGILGSVFIIYWLFGDISMMESPEALFGWLNKLFSDSDAYLIISSVSYAVMPLIYYLSYRISCKLYKKGAESFER